MEESSSNLLNSLKVFLAGVCCSLFDITSDIIDSLLHDDNTVNLLTSFLTRADVAALYVESIELDGTGNAYTM